MSRRRARTDHKDKPRTVIDSEVARADSSQGLQGTGGEPPRRDEQLPPESVELDSSSFNQRPAAWMERTQPWMNFLGPIVVVIIAASIPAMVAHLSSRDSVRVRQLEIGVGILQQPLEPTHRPLRVWAIQLINRSSDVPLDVQELLIDSLRLPQIANSPLPVSGGPVTVSIRANGPYVTGDGNTYFYSWTSSNATACQLITPSGTSGITLAGTDGPIDAGHPWMPRPGSQTTLRLTCTDGNTVATATAVIRG